MKVVKVAFAVLFAESTIRCHHCLLKRLSIGGVAVVEEVLGGDRGEDAQDDEEDDVDEDADAIYAEEYILFPEDSYIIRIIP